MTDCFNNCGKPLDALKEFNRHENLKEQGKPVKLPVAVGDTVYQIVKNNAFIRKLKVINISIFSSYEIYMKCENYGEIDIDEIGNKIFLTKEEAERAIEKIHTGSSI